LGQADEYLLLDRENFEFIPTRREIPTSQETIKRTGMKLYRKRSDLPCSVSELTLCEVVVEMGAAPEMRDATTHFRIGTQQQASICMEMQEIQPNHTFLTVVEGGKSGK
jgi:hypothetical protein